MARVSKKRAAGQRDYEAVVQRVFLRARGLCEYPGCRSKAKDPHHVVKRSQGGQDTEDNLVALCRRCHDRTDAPYSRGRIVITPLGHGRFTFEMVYAASKAKARADGTA